jgi:hypothetical protein
MSTNSSKENEAARAVLDAAQEREPDERIFTVSGVRVRLHPVSAALITDVTARIKDPKIPSWYNKDKEREEPNPDDPEYLAALEETVSRRGMAAMDAMAMFGVELIDGLPADERWLDTLKQMERRGLLDLSIYDLGDPVEQEFLYKRYVLVTNDVLLKVGRMSGVSADGVVRQEAAFQRSA